MTSKTSQLDEGLPPSAPEFSSSPDHEVGKVRAVGPLDGKPFPRTFLFLPTDNYTEMDLSENLVKPVFGFQQTSAISHDPPFQAAPKPRPWPSPNIWGMNFGLDAETTLALDTQNAPKPSFPISIFNKAPVEDVGLPTQNAEETVDASLASIRKNARNTPVPSFNLEPSINDTSAILKQDMDSDNSKYFQRSIPEKQAAVLKESENAISLVNAAHSC